MNYILNNKRQPNQQAKGNVYEENSSTKPQIPLESKIKIRQEPNFF